MRKTVWLSLCFIVLLCSVCMPADVTAEATDKARQGSSSLLSLLKQGGYLIYVRHGEATVGEDQPNLDLRDCSTQRNLSEEGKRQAIRLGEALHKLQIPMEAKVSASPFCRTKETASLAFGADRVQVDPVWADAYKLNTDVGIQEQETLLTALAAELEKVPSPGKNKIIVAHSFPKGKVLGEIPYAGAVIVKPKGRGGGYEIAGRISLQELTNL